VGQFDGPHTGTAGGLIGRSGELAAVGAFLNRARSGGAALLIFSYNKSLAAAVSRMAATLVSFVLCLAYLAVLPFHPWGLALMVGLSVLVTALIGRPEDEITAGITTTVVLVVAKLSPQEAWRQPILRLADTVIGVAVGLVAAWLGLRAIRPRIRPPESASPNR